MILLTIGMISEADLQELKDLKQLVTKKTKGKRKNKGEHRQVARDNFNLKCIPSDRILKAR